MHQAQITSWGNPPTYIEVPDLPPPNLEEVRIKVEAVGIHRVVRSRASGQHYSSGELPHIPGIDGVGTTDSGQKVYFMTMGKGVLSEFINMPKHSVFPLPEDSDPVKIAAAINPAMSSWMAFKGRTTNLPEDFTCLILGATSASGRVAIALARTLGAKKVIGAARNKTTLDTLGLDESIIIQEEVEQTDFSNLDDVDVVLDYVYGPLVLHLLKSMNTAKSVQYVHIGALSIPEITIPGQVLRAKDVTIRGSGPGSWSIKEFAKTVPQLLDAVRDMPSQPVKTAKFADVEKAWEYDGPERLVLCREL
ncbi:quinone oxidoreductase [Lecanosticta acicola]|uniref:Quinone oxidoreductase n=1 Tax=Lecanosticta acicola TaxID=111012 RepID=A0AAI8Z2A3_9PEZI|nr:quinone oxidoreductase [Lecanosticta acicola]